MSDEDDSLICPITQELFRDPVRAEDGHLYEREAITRWINQNGTSPFTRQVLNVNQLKSDEEIRKKADQQRRLSVTYNRESDQVKLPPIRPARTPHFVNRVTDTRHAHEPINRHTRCQDILRACRNMYSRRDECCGWEGSTCSSCCLCCHPYVIICVCLTICAVAPLLVILIVLGPRQVVWPTSTSILSPIPSAFCYKLNHTLTTNVCIASFTNIAYLDSGICNDFTYRRLAYSFTASSSTTTIVFAFQQTFGYWDIDNIVVWDSTTYQNVFQNGDFESGPLSPAYGQCQSTGYISNNSQLNGRYCYSDSTNGQFGYLMQNVSTTVGSGYYLEFYLQNRNGPGSSFMVLLGT